ncbi:MAG TPA: ABC transporter permease [Acidimicrobiales bacterium]
MSVIDHPLTTAPSGASFVTKILRFRELAIVVAILLVFVVTYFKNSSFASTASIQQMLSGPSIIMLLAVGETLVIITRNVDLSVGSVLGLSAYLVGDLFVHFPGMPVPLALLMGLLIGLVCGVVNGVIVAYARVPALVVTLGMLYIIRGVDALVVNGVQIQPSAIPQSFVNLGAGAILGIPYLFVIAVVVVVIVGYVMRTFRPARDLYAIGSNPDAAVLAGVRVQRRVLSAFAISGALAGLGGALWLAEFATVASTAGTGYELDVVAAVVVGGVAIFGGSGTVLGAGLGALLLNTIDQALVAARVSSFWNQAVAGALLLVAIAFDRYVSVRAEKILRVEGARHGDD